MPQSKGARVFSKRRHVAAIALAPVALAALTSVIFGLNAHADKAPDSSPKHLKAKPDGDATTATPRTAAVTPRPAKYRVVEGDTLRDVASRYGVSTAELLAANGLSWRTMIAIGQELRIPKDSSGSAALEVPSSIRSHRVAAGETLEAIARANKVQPRAIISANGLHQTSRLVVGQRLVIPNAEVMEGLAALDASGVSPA
jgi:LysM repeat protein